MGYQPFPLPQSPAATGRYGTLTGRLRHSSRALSAPKAEAAYATRAAECAGIKRAPTITWDSIAQPYRRIDACWVKSFRARQHLL